MFVYFPKQEIQDDILEKLLEYQIIRKNLSFQSFSTSINQRIKQKKELFNLNIEYFIFKVQGLDFI